MPITAVTDVTQGYANNPVQSEAEPAASIAKLGDEDSAGREKAARRKRKARQKAAGTESQQEGVGPAEPGKGEQIDVSG